MKVSGLLVFRDDVPPVDEGGTASDGLSAMNVGLQMDLVEQQS
jgi:hypothetical protein